MRKCTHIQSHFIRSLEYLSTTLMSQSLQLSTILLHAHIDDL